MLEKQQQQQQNIKFHRWLVDFSTTCGFNFKDVGV